MQTAIYHVFHIERASGRWRNALLAIQPVGGESFLLAVSGYLKDTNKPDDGGSIDAKEE
jgi:hypothetical protein